MNPNIMALRHKLNLLHSTQPMPREFKEFLTEVDTLLNNHSWTITRLEKLQQRVEAEKKTHEALEWAYDESLHILNQIR